VEGPRYVVGIDLGTTNCAMATLDLAEETPRIELDAIPQLVNPGEVASGALLPSFLYLPDARDFPAGSIALPWASAPDAVTGELARRRGAERPGRLIASAKSWLCHGGVDRTAPILPWQPAEDAPRLSPLEASARYLTHLAQAWQSAHDDGQRLADQDVLVTVPASFDETARELTLQAAAQAGLSGVRLLEEPQAAFYAWLDHLGDAWRDRVTVGDLVLVCDIGGGTTDFSLIAVSEADGALALTRVAVGDHILLGGDNMDLALARTAQQRLERAGHRVDPLQLQALWLQCRAAKERLFEDASADRSPVTLLGRGSKLVGGTITSDITRDDLDRTVLEGFFPRVPYDAEPARQRRTGLQELGLPYAADPAVTRHLARFLLRQSADAPGAETIRRGPRGLAAPTHVLFNGGVMKAPVVRARILDTLNAWLADEGFAPIGADAVLEAPDLDRAVARGAACYGAARRRQGIRIRGGAPRTYYIGIESALPAVPGLDAPLKALCVVPFGMEEGTEASIPGREFGLVVGEPAEFRFLSSTIRKHDEIGTLIDDWGDELGEHEPLAVTLEGQGTAADQVVPVRLQTRVTELGTLELWCVARDGGQRWKLAINIRERGR
jgi:molecular chaperone DnaK (HSP70)